MGDEDGNAQLITQSLSADVERMNGVLHLEKLRKRSHLTQSALARRLGLSQWRVSAIGHASSDLRLGTLTRYGESLGRTVEVTAVVDGERITLLTP